MGKRALPWWSLALMVSIAPSAVAHQQASQQQPVVQPAVQERAINAQTYEAALLQASGHPNELSRWRGIWNYDNGRAKEARAHFERGAFYGDKLSQHFLTLMYWSGDGVDRDPVQAYVWADLAAERGNSRDLVRVRERIWSELSAEQQRQAIAIGADYYARYGDAVAMKRNNAEMRRFMRTQTGSRVGLLTSPLDVNAGRPDLWASGASSSYGPYKAVGTAFYADSRTRPAEYWQEQDLSLRTLMRQIGAGKVEIGEVRKVEPAADGK